MLTMLRIKNLALVEDLTLEFEPGYNVITGETGTGKSIIIGALKLVLGERADRTWLRSGCDVCMVEAAFDVANLEAPLEQFLDKNGLEPCEDNQLLLKRVFTASGSNRQFVNGSPTALGTLTSIGEWLVDIHGPHDHQSLLHPARQLEILDAYARCSGQRAEFSNLLKERVNALARKSELIVDESTYAQQVDLLSFQVHEITSAGLSLAEEEQIEAEHTRAANAARLLELGHAILAQMVEEEVSVLTQAGQITRLLQELSQLDATTIPLLHQHKQTLETLSDLAREISSYLDQIEVDPARLHQLETRLNLIQSLKRKYGSTLSEVIAFGEQAQERLNSLKCREEQLSLLNQAIKALEHNLRQTGRKLSDGRRSRLPKLRSETHRQLKALGFPSACFDVAMRSHLPTAEHDFDTLPSSGFDEVEFQFTPNPGEPARPLRSIASSGELARVMLALKTVLAMEDRIPVLVFDEVDANVGGEIAHTVGAKMKQIGLRRQVFCITHLPQVAAPADTHYVASKQVAAGRTHSQMIRVSGEQRVDELARMLGGRSKAARQHAQSILASTATSMRP